MQGDVQERGYEFYIICMVLHHSHRLRSMLAFCPVDSHVIWCVWSDWGESSMKAQRLGFKTAVCHFR